MRWLLFLSRLSFICGIFFLAAVSLQIKNWNNDEAITSTIVIIGYAMGMIVVPITDLCYLGLVLAGKKPTRWVPLWLILSNILFLLVLLFYIFYLLPE
jgi:hypothetical protein